MLRSGESAKNTAVAIKVYLNEIKIYSFAPGSLSVWSSVATENDLKPLPLVAAVPACTVDLLQQFSRKSEVLCSKNSPQLVTQGTPLGLGNSRSGTLSPASWKMFLAADGHFSRSYSGLPSHGRVFQAQFPKGALTVRRKLRSVPPFSGGVP